MSDSILAAEDKLDHKLELGHNPITRMADNFVIKVGEIFDWIWVALVIVIIGNVTKLCDLNGPPPHNNKGLGQH